MSLKDIGTLIFIAVCFLNVDCAPSPRPTQCLPKVKKAVLHYYGTSGTICKREARFYDSGESGRLQKRSLSLIENEFSKTMLRTLDQQEEENPDLLDQLTVEEIEEVYNDIVTRIGRADISRNEIISFSKKCCQNLEICRTNPKEYIRC